jgi:hypothetical protein
VGEKIAEVHGALVAFRFQHDVFVRIYKGNARHLCPYPLIALVHYGSSQDNDIWRLSGFSLLSD